MSPRLTLEQFAALPDGAIIIRKDERHFAHAEAVVLQRGETDDRRVWFGLDRNEEWTDAQVWYDDDVIVHLLWSPDERPNTVTAALWDEEPYLDRESEPWGI